MQNKDYKTVQIPVDDYELLRDFCEATGMRMGKFVGKLIQENCSVLKKKPDGSVLRVENERGVG